MCLIVYGHTAAGTTIVLTPPVYLKQFGVTMFLFATAFTLARETRPSSVVVFNRLFRMFLYAGSFALVLTAVSAFAGEGPLLSNYLPLLGGANVFFDNFPANPTTWYVGTYLHFLLLWALVLRRVNVRPWLVVAACLAIEIPVRMLLITVGGGYVAYMALTNWITVFLFGLWMGASGSQRLRAGGGWIYVSALLVWLAASAFAWRAFINPSPTFPFQSIEGGGVLDLLLISASASLLYFGVTWFAFQAARRTPAPFPVRFISQNSLIIFILHMPLVTALHPWLVSLGFGYWQRELIQLLVMLPGLALVSEFLNAVVMPDVLRDRIWNYFSAARTAPARSARRAMVPVIALLVLGGGVGTATAGEQEQATSPAIFGQTPDTNRPVTLVNASIFSGDGESLVGDDGISPAAVTRSYYMGLQTTATYSRRTTSRMFSASGATAVRYFPSTSNFITIDRSARVGLVQRIGTRGNFSATQSVQYSPFHQFGEFVGFGGPNADEAPLANPDEALGVSRAQYDLGTAVGFDRTFRRASLSLGYTSRLNLSSDPGGNMTTHRAAVGVKFDLWRYASLVVGTASRFGNTGATSPPTRTQDIDLGIDYNRALTFSRKTTLNFRTGTAIVSRTGTSADPLELGRQFRFLANVGASRAIGRYWEARVSYDRNLQFVDAFPDPFFTDGVIGRISGPISRRVNLLVQADYTTGKAVDAEAVALDKTFRGGRAQARVNVAVSRFWQFYGEYYYSENHLSVGALQALPDGLIPRKYARGLRIGLNLWAPHVH
jgi:hypothetical protein